MGTKKRKDILDKDLIKLRRQGMSYQEIYEHYRDNGVEVSYGCIYERLRFKTRIIEDDLQEEEEDENEIDLVYASGDKKCVKRNISIDDRVKEILLTGRSIKNYCIQEECELDELAIRERIKKLRLIVEHSRKQGDKWVADNEFLDVIRVLESIGNFYPGDKYRIYLRPYINGKMCKNGSISYIKAKVFKDNADLMVYILSSYQLRYGEEYDIKVWNKLKKEYEAKIDKYFNRLHILEKNSRNKQKQNKRSKKADKQIQNEVAKKEVNNPNQGDER